MENNFFLLTLDKKLEHLNNNDKKDHPINIKKKTLNHFTLEEQRQGGNDKDMLWICC